MAERDETLASQAQQGNMTAFAALVDRHKGHVYRTLYQVVGDEQDAQDLAQEVFLKLYRSLSGFRGEAAFATWLHRLTLNTAFDWLRARRRRPLQVPLEPAVEQGVEPASPEGSAEDIALGVERREVLLQALRELPPNYRQVILLRHFHHLNYQEIAERIRAPVRTVETRLYRGRALLKAALAAREGGEGSAVPGSVPQHGPLLGRNSG